MTSKKFSQIASGDDINLSTDKILAVRSGTDDVLVDLTAQFAACLQVSGGTMSGNIDMGGHAVTNANQIVATNNSTFAGHFSGTVGDVWLADETDGYVLYSVSSGGAVSGLGLSGIGVISYGASGSPGIIGLDNTATYQANLGFNDGGGTQYAGRFVDGTNFVTLADGTYALNATGTILVTNGAVFGNSLVIEAPGTPASSYGYGIDLGGDGSAIFGSGGSYQVQLSNVGSNGYAINATGNNTFINTSGANVYATITSNNDSNWATVMSGNDITGTPTNFAGAFYNGSLGGGVVFLGDATNGYAINALGGSHFVDANNQWDTWISYGSAQSAVYAQTNSGSNFSAALASDLQGASIWAGDGNGNTFKAADGTFSINATGTSQFADITDEYLVLLSTSAGFQSLPAAASFKNFNNGNVVDICNADDAIEAIGAAYFNNGGQAVALNDGTYAINSTGGWFVTGMPTTVGTTGQVYINPITNALTVSP